MAASCVPYWDSQINVRFIQLCPDTTSFNIVLETSNNPGILYSGLKYPNNTKFIQRTVTLGGQELLTYHLEDISEHISLLQWKSNGTIIIGGRIDSLLSIYISPPTNKYLGDTISFNFINAVRNSGNYDLFLGKKLLFKNKPYFLGSDYIDSSYLTTMLNSADTLFVYRSGTKEMVSYLPYTPYASKGNCTIAISGMEGGTDIKKLRLNFYPNNE